MMRLTLCFSLILLWTPIVSSQQIEIVSPNQFADIDADAASGLDCCPFDFRYQQIVPASEFSALPDGKGFLTAVAWRPDVELVTEARTTELGKAIALIGVTSNTALDDTFDENVPNSLTTVFEGSITISTPAENPDGGSMPFDYVVELDEPFLYDVSQGNLFFDWKFSDGWPAPGHGGDSFSADSDIAAGGLIRFATPADAVAGFFVQGLVSQFTFEPVPEPIIVLPQIALLGMLCCRHYRSSRRQAK